jgi:hypothetical protein
MARALRDQVEQLKRENRGRRARGAGLNGKYAEFVRKNAGLEGNLGALGGSPMALTHVGKPRSKGYVMAMIRKDIDAAHEQGG